MTLDLAGLVAQQAWVRYGARSDWVLSDVTLSLGTGRLVALVGPNGAGKTTLFRAWLGFEKVERGSVSVAGRDPRSQCSAVMHLIAYVAQSPALYRSLTPVEHLEYASLQRPSFDLGAARRALVDASVPMRSRAANLSGGQRVQLALAIARGCNARVLLLDEPLANLDPMARRIVIGALAGYAHQRDATVVVSSHLVGDLEGAFDDIVVLNAGRVVLAAPITSSLAGWVVQPVAKEELAASDEIGRLTGRDGRPYRVRRASSAEGGETLPATLEDVVLALLGPRQEP